MDIGDTKLFVPVVVFVNEAGEVGTGVREEVVTTDGADVFSAGAALNRLDGVYYVDPRPVMQSGKLAQEIKDFQTFIIRDIWRLAH